MFSLFGLAPRAFSLAVHVVEGSTSHTILSRCPGHIVYFQLHTSSGAAIRPIEADISTAFASNNVK